MKLKKILASFTAAAMAVTTMAFTPLTASAAATDLPEGTENVLKKFELSGTSTNLSAWTGCWVQLWGIDESYFTRDNYVKVTLSLSTAPEIAGDGSKMSTVASWGWSNYSGWVCAGKFGQGTVTADEQVLVPATNSQDDLFYCYLPTSDFTVGSNISGNVYSAYDGTTIESVELVEFSSYVAPTLPEYEYAFDEASGSVAAGTWGQPAKTAVGDDQTVTAETLGGDFVIKVPYTGNSKPKVVLSDGSGEGGALNWIQVDPEGVVDGVAYFTKANLSTAWTAAGGKADFSDVTTIFIGAQADALTVNNVALYSTVAPKIKPESISLNEENLELTAGAEPVQLIATVSPADAEYEIEWTSDNEAAATVDADGNVTPVAEGEAVITAAITGTELSATCAVTVSNDVIEPTSITLDKKTLTLTTSDAPAKLTATVLPKGASAVVEWTSSNTDVATVDAKGNVTAVAVGKAVITASVKDTELSATCAVEVVDKSETGYTGTVDLPVNKIAVQKTAVSNGTYNSRFVMRVAAADIANASEVVFTLNNGTKTVTASTNKYYTSLTVNGTKTPAGNGYVLLTFTVKDIPEDTTVTCTKVEIK